MGRAHGLGARLGAWRGTLSPCCAPAACAQAFDQHLNMIVGDVEETVTTVEIDDETYEEIIKVRRTQHARCSARQPVAPRGAVGVPPAPSRHLTPSCCPHTHARADPEAHGALPVCARGWRHFGVCWGGGKGGSGSAGCLRVCAGRGAGLPACAGALLAPGVHRVLRSPQCLAPHCAHYKQTPACPRSCSLPCHARHHHPGVAATAVMSARAPCSVH